jgi:aminopeptidase N
MNTAIKTFYRNAYQAPLFQITQVDLSFQLDPNQTQVYSKLRIKPNSESAIAGNAVLELDGEDLELVEIKINGQAHARYELKPKQLHLKKLPQGSAEFLLEIKTICKPALNTMLEGLYISNGHFVTQCEAEGFRRITYFLDRPDVMARYRVTIEADKSRYPILLSNGNLESQSDLPHGKHQAIWVDPFPKPSYLFALVAGNLQCLERNIKAKSGANKLLQIWANPTDVSKTEYAMDSLVHSIRWDEERFNLELDLDRFMIVSVGDFNMGAMENKGLNIFNSQYVLADPELTLDHTYFNIESIVAHEYFHNWTGNRVTCRDWFQLSLKEGLTVFRDQEFSSDRIGTPSGRALRRIKVVNTLRTSQFMEDAGPMAHPVRPESYETIDNFYTSTVYNKGAEVIGMMQTLLGIDGFRKGFDLYIQRHDGQAVTCDDFVAAIADANQYDLTQFKLWYSQAGTPRVQVQEHFDEQKQEYTLMLTQSCPPSPKQDHKANFHIPLRTKLISPQHQESLNQEWLWELKNKTETVTLNHITQKPTLSINRQFSAPIILEYEQHEADLIRQLEHDDDAFNRWEASQKLNTHLILKGESPSSRLLGVYKNILNNPELDPDYRALIFTLPSENYLYQQLDQVDPLKLAQDRLNYLRILAAELEPDWLQIYQDLQTNEPYSPDISSMGRRSLKNTSLNMLLQNNTSKWESLAQQQYEKANNMTDRLGALSPLTLLSADSSTHYLNHFYKKFEAHDSVIDTWFSIQALRYPSSKYVLIDAVQELCKHPAFKMSNPNRTNSLLSSFCFNNSLSYHQLDGSGYAFWTSKVIELDAINPSIAARLSRANLNWRKLTLSHQELIQKAIKKVLDHSLLSVNVREILSKTLA